MSLARLAAAAIVALSPLAAHATSLVDGSFEAAGAGVGDYCYDGFAAGGNPACSPGAWGTQGGVIRSGSGAWGGTTTPAGNYYGMLQGAQVLSQTVVATSNGTLALSWIDANRTNNGGAHSYTVSVNGNVLGTYTSGFGGFVAKSATFGGLSGQSYTIAFNGIVAGDTTSFIDNATLAVVPEPATWAMLFAGFGLVGFAMRRRSTGTVVA
jgi:hypothetical protein